MFYIPVIDNVKLGVRFMTKYCEICGDELSPEEEDEGICQNCKASQKNEDYEKDENYIDPGIT